MRHHFSVVSSGISKVWTTGSRLPGSRITYREGHSRQDVPDDATTRLEESLVVPKIEQDWTKSNMSITQTK